MLGKLFGKSKKKKEDEQKEEVFLENDASTQEASSPPAENVTATDVSTSKGEDTAAKLGSAPTAPMQSSGGAGPTDLFGGQMPDITDEMIDQMLAGDVPGMPKIGRMQKMALKGLKKMPMEKRRAVFADAIKKMQDKGGDQMQQTKEQMIAQIEEMRASGQINSKEYKIAKKRLGV